MWGLTNNKYLLLTVPEVEKSKIKVPADAAYFLQDDSFLIPASLGGRELEVSSLRAATPVMGLHPRDLSTSQGAHGLKPSHRGTRFNL